MNRGLLRKLGILLWLTTVWVLLWGNVSIANILGGMAVATLIMVLLPLPRVPVEGRIHLWSLLKLICLAVWYAAQSSIQVAWLAIRPSAPPVTGVLRYHLNFKSDLVLTLCVDVINLIPGTMVLEIDQPRRIAYIHVLDVGSEKAVNQFYSTISQLERLFVASFERDSDWQPSPWHAQDEPDEGAPLPEEEK
ncbi:Na+/H+ antiporter subunit E [Rhodococcus sp. NPDC058521]|uniref:Na+/H+ antiporter subunit E n=1 Tax=Rhodococcus sp. NPDC058521 TaxID=3346536 RepID=UPI0036463F16